MNRFEYADSRFMPNEVYVRCDMAVRLYDGDTKVMISRMPLAVEKKSISHSSVVKNMPCLDPYPR